MRVDVPLHELDIPVGIHGNDRHAGVDEGADQGLALRVVPPHPFADQLRVCVGCARGRRSLRVRAGAAAEDTLHQCLSGTPQMQDQARGRHPRRRPRCHVLRGAREAVDEPDCAGI